MLINKTYEYYNGQVTWSSFTISNIIFIMHNYSITKQFDNALNVKNIMTIVKPKKCLDYSVS